MTSKQIWDEIKSMILALEKDTPERKRLSRDLIRACRESVKKYSALVESSPDIIYVLDAEGNFSFVGGAVESLLGFTPEELTGKHFTSIIWPEDVEKAKRRIDERRTGKRSTIKIEVRFLTKKGKSKDFDVMYKTVELHAFGIYDKPVSEKDKKFMGTYGAARDITTSKRAENAIKRTSKKLRMAHNKRKLLSQKLIEILERDRLQVAVKLHEQIGQTLTTLKMDLEAVDSQAERIDIPSEGRINAAKEKTIQAIRDIRTISYDLMPVMLHILGLVSSIRDLIERVEKGTDMEINFFTRDIPRRFNPDKELALYRIVQEALTNIIKHSRGKKVFLNLVKTDEKILLSVEDNGRGFDLKKVKKISKAKGPLGLLIMEERAIQVDGKFTIESKIGGGTYLMTEIPL